MQLCYLLCVLFFMLKVASFVQLLNHPIHFANFFFIVCHMHCSYATTNSLTKTRYYFVFCKATYIYICTFFYQLFALLPHFVLAHLWSQKLIFFLIWSHSWTEIAFQKILQILKLQILYFLWALIASVCLFFISLTIFFCFWNTFPRGK